MRRRAAQTINEPKTIKNVESGNPIIICVMLMCDMSLFNMIEIEQK